MSDTTPSSGSTAAAAGPLMTPLYALHRELGARMVEFAGYSMPVSYPAGLIAEHRHCRSAAALFDVSHMGQLRLSCTEPGGAAAGLERLVPVDVIGLAPGRQRYAFFTNASGGLLDDLMVTRVPPAHAAAFGELFLVVNASRKADDTRHLLTHAAPGCHVVPMPERALLALQGPLAATALARLNPAVASLVFMSGGVFPLSLGTREIGAFITRSGYTGEDGFEISVENDDAVALAKVLLGQPEVAPAGLGARDTLRLEAGLCLYGHDIDETTSPVEAGLTWAIQKVRRPGGARAGGYPGATVVERHLTAGPPSRRIGLTALERVPVREGAPVLDAAGRKLGHVTSGTLAPTVNQPIAMAYLSPEHAEPHHEVWAEVRGKRVPMRVTPMPFAPHRYHRG